MLLRVCFTISYGIIANIFPQYDLVMSDGTFLLPVQYGDDFSQISLSVGELISKISNSSRNSSLGFSII